MNENLGIGFHKQMGPFDLENANVILGLFAALISKLRGNLKRTYHKAKNNENLDFGGARGMQRVLLTLNMSKSFWDHSVHIFPNWTAIQKWFIVEWNQWKSVPRVANEQLWPCKWLGRSGVILGLFCALLSRLSCNWKMAHCRVKQTCERCMATFELERVKVILWGHPLQFPQTWVPTQNGRSSETDDTLCPRAIWKCMWVLLTWKTLCHFGVIFGANFLKIGLHVKNNSS